MDITLTHEEINLAVEDYLGTVGIDTSANIVDVNLIAGRGGNGNRAEVTVTRKDMLKKQDNFAKGAKTESVPENNAPEPEEVTPAALDANTETLKASLDTVTNVSEASEIATAKENLGGNAKSIFAPANA